jgi:hypothetical protein
MNKLRQTNTPIEKMRHSFFAKRIHPACRAIALAACLALAGVASAEPSPQPSPDETRWPAVRPETKPWTRWFWMGNAVNEAELTRHLEMYNQAGLGGVEVSPIYGAKGYESRFIEFLSPRWMTMLDHTTAEARRLEMGVDMIEGTGWPFGGPNVRPQDAALRVVTEAIAAPGGHQLKQKFKQKPVLLMAYGPDGKKLDLTDKVDAHGQLTWDTPAGDWKVYSLSEAPTRQKVKRAGPGGEGFVLDPFSAAAMHHYLERFSQAFGADSHGVGAFFNDSFEAFGADWTPDFFDQFQKRRGYDLREYLPAFAGDGDPDRVARVRCDYRQTISDLLLDGFTRTWVEWCHQHGAKARNQAHGSPGNLLDLYAATDIPETESFGAQGADVAFSKFASSAAHLRNEPLASSESCTWLDEHFRVTPAKIKSCLDGLFLAGINHVLYHATAFSPADAPWPGWLFYASVDFGPGGGLWHDYPALNAYVTRCQSFLQLGQSDNDVLLYHPVPDLWMQNIATTRNARIQYFSVGAAEQWLHKQPVGEAADYMLAHGYTFDYVSDDLLHDRKAASVILIPKCRYLPVGTLQNLIRLANAGAMVLFQGPLPQDIPGLAELENRRKQFHEALDAIHWADGPGSSIRQASVGNGHILLGDDLDALLTAAHVRREAMADRGVQFLRRRDADGTHYLLVNRSPDRIEGWLPLAVPAASAMLFDPDSGHTGLAAARAKGSGSEVYVQLDPAQTMIVRTFANEPVHGTPWTYLSPAGDPQALTGTWDLHFIEGGPKLPADAKLDKLTSWTELPDPQGKSFSGTAQYTLRFTKPGGDASDWLLDLGEVHETVRVKLNGQNLGTLWHPPYRIPLGSALRGGENLLELEVTNLAANRIADMDRRKVKWNNFYDISVVNLKYKPFDASSWEPLPSGIIGPVKLIPCRIERP